MLFLFAKQEYKRQYNELCQSSSSTKVNEYPESRNSSDNKMKRSIFLFFVVAFAAVVMAWVDLIYVNILIFVSNLLLISSFHVVSSSDVEVTEPLTEANLIELCQQ